MLLGRRLIAAASLGAWMASAAWAAPDLPSLAAPIRDYSAVVTATQVNTPELVKISKDYARSFQIKTTRIYYRSPNHFKVDGSIGPVSVVYVINGNEKAWKYGPIHGRRDVSDAPGQKQGLLDFGILTADQLDDYTWKFVREEGGSDGKLYVYEMRFKNFRKDPSRRLIWVDPVHHVVVRRQIFHQFHDDQLKMDMRFGGITSVGPGSWAPTIIKVYNAEGKLGAVSRQSDIRVNRGVPASAFEL